MARARVVSGLWQNAIGDKVARLRRPAIPRRMGDQDVTQAAWAKDRPAHRARGRPPRLAGGTYGDLVCRRSALRAPGPVARAWVVDGGAAPVRRSSGLSAGDRSG